MAVTAAHTMRKFLNDPGQVTSDFLDGLASAHPDVVRYDREQRIVVRRNAPVEGKVGLVSAGGTGVEPLHGGFVGLGMLDAACPGEIFTSPNPDQIMAATRVADAGAGVLHVIKNFPGEVMNFKLVEMDAEDEGLTTEAVLIDDDVAVPKTHPAGRRGIGATVLVEKLAGAAAERGEDLQAVATVARRVNARARSFGIALSSCTPPGAGRAIFELPPGEIELGIGISGEPSSRREPMRTARELATLMVDEVLDDLRPAKDARVLPMLSGLGGTPPIELYLLYGHIDCALREAGLQPARRLVGNYITSLDMAGAALTVLELDDELLELWDAPVHTAALRWGV